LGDAVAVGLGAIVGAGLYVVTGVAAGIAGPAFLVGLVLAAVAAACNALSSAQLAARYPQAGGTYEYGYQVLGPWWGFAAGWMFLVSKLAAGATVALAFGALVAPAYGLWIGAAAIAGLVIANLDGIRKAGSLNLAIVAVTVGTLLLLIVAGAPRIDAAHFQPFVPRGGRSVLESAGLLFFAFTGYARLATLGEEVRDPRVTIPRAIVLALGLATVLYLAVSAVVLGILGASAMASAPAPVVAAAQRVGVGPLVAFGAGTALLGVLLSQILGISRMMFAMARRHDLPARLATVNEKGTPLVAVVATGFLILGFLFLGGLRTIATVAAFSILLYYGIANLAALRMPREGRWLPGFVPALGLALCAVLAAGLDPRVAATGLGVLAVGLAGRALTIWRASDRNGGSPAGPGDPRR
jgi:APA family basic amino acid/polyamine antiporter